MDMNNEIMETMSKLLTMVKPNLVKCELKETEHSSIVIVTCENGYQYLIDITGNSPLATVAAVFSKMSYK